MDFLSSNAHRRPGMRTLSLIAFVSFIGITYSVPTKNITITVSDDTTDHGVPTMLCTPAGWMDVFSFFVASYFAHAATVKSSPGDSRIDRIRTTFRSLLFPFSGALIGSDS